MGMENKDSYNQKEVIYMLNQHENLISQSYEFNISLVCNNTLSAYEQANKLLEDIQNFRSQFPKDISSKLKKGDEEINRIEAIVKEDLKEVINPKLKYSN